MNAAAEGRKKQGTIIRRHLISIIDKMFKIISDDKTYSQLEYENYVLRSQLERATGTGDYFR